MFRIFLLPYLGNRSKSDPCSYELFCLESHILSFPKVLQIPSESPSIREAKELEEKIISRILWRCYIFFTIKANPVFTDVRCHLWNVLIALSRTGLSLQQLRHCHYWHSFNQVTVFCEFLSSSECCFFIPDSGMGVYWRRVWKLLTE